MDLVKHRKVYMEGSFNIFVHVLHRLFYLGPPPSPTKKGISSKSDFHHHPQTLQRADVLLERSLTKGGMPFDFLPPGKSASYDEKWWRVKII